MVGNVAKMIAGTVNNRMWPTPSIFNKLFSERKHATRLVYAYFRSLQRVGKQTESANVRFWVESRHSRIPVDAQPLHAAAVLQHTSSQTKNGQILKLLKTMKKPLR